MSKARTLGSLFLSMLKIGLFTFGGGYAMIHILENECVKRKGWLDGDEFFDLVTVAESTPGPIAINCATYVGYKKAGALGALFATLGMCLPSFLIVYLISLFFDRFLALSAVAAAFRGIRACVVFLILSAGVKMLKKIKKNAYNLTAMIAVFACFVTFSLLSVSFSSIFYILICGAAGLFLYLLRSMKKDRREEKK